MNTTKHPHGAKAHAPILYCGKTKAGHITITRGTERRLYVGHCSQLRLHDGNWSTRNGGFSLPATDGRTDENLAIEVFVARGARTGTLWLIQGFPERVLTAQQKSSARKPMPLPAYREEMERIKAALELGLDPMVDMPFNIRHSGRSAATTYRDIAAGLLDKPTKRGRSSAWPFSAVDAYSRGERVHAA